MKSKAVLVALVLVLVIGAVATFYGAQREPKPYAANQPGQTAPKPNPEQPEPDSGEPIPTPAASQMVVSDETGISLVMAIEPDLQTAAHVVVSVMLNTHGGDLAGYDLARLALYEVDGKRQIIDGAEFKEPNPGDPHHRSGTLLIPRATDGRSWLGENTAELKVIVTGIPKGTNRVLTWAQPWQWAQYPR